VPAAWKAYFDQTGGREAGDQPHSTVQALVQAAARAGARGPAAASTRKRRASRPLRQAGHRLPLARPPGATLDPLGMMPPQPAPDLSSASTACPRRPDREIDVATYFGAPRMKLRDLLAKLKATYSGSIGAEFMHISDAAQRHWMQERLEAAPAITASTTPRASASSSA
jgi:2-oxoglutarate dehydrogenase E1 component